MEPELFVSNLPVNCDVHYIENRLRKMCSNRGGKVIRVNPPNAVLKFSDEESAKRSAINVLSVLVVKYVKRLLSVC